MHTEEQLPDFSLPPTQYQQPPQQPPSAHTAPTQPQTQTQPTPINIYYQLPGHHSTQCHLL
eukprot:12401071-Karenia_brevis.AAC.1